MELGCDYDEVTEVTEHGIPLSSLTGKWPLEVHVNKVTYVASVKVPFYDPNNPVDGAKQGREQFLKQMRDDNGGYLGMGYRGKFEKESNVPDPYFKLCPRFSNVGYTAT